MAGVRDLTFLLLWAAVIGVSSYVTTFSPPRTMTDSTLTSVTSQSVITSPPRTTAAAPVVPSASSALTLPRTPPTFTSDSSSQAFTSTNVFDTSPPLSTTSPSSSNLTQNKTSPAITTPTTTVNDSTRAQPVTEPTLPPPLCSYTVRPIKFGLQIDITSSPPGFYTIKINETGQHETEETFNVDDQTSSHNITYLKPCTEYEHNVIFNDGPDGQTLCSSTDNTTRTFDMSQSDIKDVSSTSSCVPGSVCYWSEWDISSSMSTSDHIPAQSCTSDSKIFCIKPGFNDICSDLTTTLTSGSCSSFSLTKNITVGFLNPNEIHSTVQPKLPAEINTPLPSKCHLTTDYTCQENGQIKDLSELEPFTDYSCIGHIKDMNNVTIMNTTDIPVRINCDLQINSKEPSATNTSIHLSWTTTSNNCQKLLSNLSELSYECSCSPGRNNPEYVSNKDPQGGSCEIKGLQPYTNYNCRVQPRYNNKPVDTSARFTETTKIGVPEKISSLTPTNPENNEIEVTCDYGGGFNGQAKKYRARLYLGDDLQLLDKVTQNTCRFVFKDLSYLTTYRVEVTAYNGVSESVPIIKHVNTQYNDKALTGALVFFIILIIITAVVVCSIYVLKRRKSRNSVNEDMMLESSAIYMNAPPPGRRHKEAR